MKFIRQMIKINSFLRYFFRFKRFPKSMTLTSRYGIIKIDNDFFVYDEKGYFNNIELSEDIHENVSSE